MMLRGVVFVTTDASEKRIVSIIRVEKMSKLGTMLEVTVMMEAIRFSETQVITRATRRHIPKTAFFILSHPLLFTGNLCRFQCSELLKGHVRLEVFTAVTMKNDVFWDVTPCESCKNRCFGGT
jgi:hypothetical protein